MKPVNLSTDRGVILRWMAALGCLIMLLSVATAFADPPSSPLNDSEDIEDGVEEVRNYVPGELVVRLTVQDSTSISFINDAFGTEVLHYLYQLRSYLLTTDYTGDLETLAAEIQKDTLVEVAHPNYLVDPLQPVQGSFPFSDEQNEGSYDDQYASNTLHLPSAHTMSMGSGVTVAVIDGGVDFNHPVFEGTVESGWDYIDEDNYSFDEPGGDNSGHGTFVAGVVHLVAPEATIRAYRVTEIDGESHGYLVAEAIMQAVQDGCEVINLSMALMAEHSIIADAIAYAKDNNVIVVAAGGNGSSDVPVYPASDPNVLAVAALDEQNVLADLSRYGSYIDLCAPGIDVYSPYQNDLFAWWGGTSFAAPFVAGQAALIVSRMPGQPVWSEVRNLIESTAIDIDDINPDHAGQLGAGLIDPVGALQTFPQVDTGWIDPTAQSLQVYVDDSLFLQASVGVYSTNAPAKFFATVQDQRDFVWIQTDSGYTNDSLYFIYDSNGLPVGTYVDTIRVDIEGVDNGPFFAEVTLSVVPWGANGTYCDPDTLFFSAPEGYSLTMMLEECSYLFSENAPETYYAWVQPGSLQFTFIQDSVGLTGDSVCVLVNPVGLSAGTYYNDVVYFVESAEDTIAVLTTCLEIYGDTTATDSAWLTLPSNLSYEIEEGTEIIYGASAGIYSTNAPAAYTGSIPGGAQFTTLENPTGVTLPPGSHAPEQFTFTVQAGTLPIGLYADTVVIQVDGVQGNLYFILTLRVTDPNATDSAWVSHGPLDFTLPVGSSDSIFTVVNLFSSNAPAAYNVNFSDSDVVYIRWPHFVTPLVTSGTTNDSIPFLIQPGDLEAGVHKDTLIFEVEGVAYNPYAVFTLTLTDSPPTGDSAWLVHGNLTFSLPEKSFELASGSVEIHSSNAPAAYTVSFPPDYTGSPISPTFTTLDHDSGLTNDTVGFSVTVGALAPGMYRDTLIFEVEGVPGSVYTIITLNVTPISTGGDSAWVSPDTLVINIPPGSPDTIYACFVLGSTNAPASFYSWVDDTMMIGTWFTQVTGFTGDTVCYAVPTANVYPGSYCDPVLFYVEGVDQPVRQIVCTNKDTGSDTLPAPALAVSQNYPNPFNPTTNIAYSLGKASKVEVTVYNVLGQRVVTLVDGEQAAGPHTVTWDGTDAHGNVVAGGIYFYRISTAEFKETRKMLYLK